MAVNSLSDYNNVVVFGHNELCWSMAVNSLSDYNNVVVFGHNEMWWSMAVNSLSDYITVVLNMGRTPPPQGGFRTSRGVGGV